MRGRVVRGEGGGMSEDVCVWVGTTEGEVK